ncbi:methylthioribose-1-phosphate isomerase [Aminivibrio pyruvatiphilus]|jgi:methylthioribose-1-phosphate isomerase|uniref:Methylthioribose-1-phosphate isomerase n=1 Tax=Aminivibrio pyruvatiphilus TaxID=1005740 RepID=A0A4R8M5H3_9BACT|nr:S-methyl-5-thioribose-1-phosphate isomerase [Aminivibrio pyruvatiphilus]TDY60569.1 methylthioribose-1-phosphate isomerase [Aminivibrio pyruvatiphilus]
MVPPVLYWKNNRLYILDQRVLPGAVMFLECTTADDVAVAIETLAVRGAPAIGIAAAFGVAMASRDGRTAALDASMRLVRTRPTAVNLFWALRRMEETMASLPDDGLFENLLAEAGMILADDLECNRAMGRAGAELLPPACTVITHCNAGALATGGHGTALGVIRSAREAGKDVKVFSCETRPVLQGARLTVWELLEDGFDVTLICDNMAGSLMKKGGIDAVIVGADRIAGNGDTANKIGTYPLAVLARHHGIPFYVAAPLTTIDPGLPSGREIPIEERKAEEVKRLPGGGMLPDDYTVWNPAFDVTDGDLISAVITEKGVLRPPYGPAISALFPKED